MRKKKYVFIVFLVAIGVVAYLVMHDEGPFSGSHQIVRDPLTGKSLATFGQKDKLALDVSRSSSGHLLVSTSNDSSLTASIQRLAEAFHKEKGGDPSSAAALYRQIAISSTGSAQIGALNRYRFSVERMHADSGKLKAFIDKLKAKEPKDDFELMFLSQYKTEVDFRKYYSEVAANPDSPFSEYAEMMRIHWLEREDDVDKNDHRLAVIQMLEKFTVDHPDSQYVPHVKLKIASRLMGVGDTKNAQDVYRDLLGRYPEDMAACAACIVELDLLADDEHLVKQDVKQAAQEILLFYGTIGNGYYLREDFDLTKVDLTELGDIL